MRVVRGRAAEPPGLFVGRSAELASLRELSTRVRMVVLYGPPGVGKTALLQRAVSALAHDLGARVLGHCCRPGDSIDSIAAALLGPPLRTRGAVRALLRLADAGPLVLGLDDVHEAAAPELSAELVKLVASGRPLWLLVTSRTLLPISPVVLDHGVLRLGGLGPDEARELWRALEQLYGPAARSFDEVAGLGGSPLALKHAFAEPGLGSATDPLALQALPPLAQRLLRELATHRRPVPLAALNAARDPAEVRAALAELVRRFMVERAGDDAVALHGVVRDAVSARWPGGPDEHARAAAFQRGRSGAEAERELLYHSLLSGELAAVDALLELHASPLRRVLPADAQVDRDLAWALRRRAQLTPPLPVSLRLLEARVLARLGALAEAHELAAAVGIGADPQAALDLGEIAYFRGRVPEALQALTRAVDNPDLAFPARAWAGVLLTDVQRARGDVAAAEQAIARAIAPVRGLSELERALRLFLEALLARDREAYGEALRLLVESHQSVQSASVIAAGVELPLPISELIERRDTAHAALERMLCAAAGAPAQRAEPRLFIHDSAFFRLLARVLEAEELLLRGRLREASSLARAVQGDADAGDFAALAAWSSWIWGRAHAAVGGAVEVSRELPRRISAAEDGDLGRHAVQLRIAAAAAWLARGDGVRARVEVAACAALPRGPGSAARLLAIHATAAGLDGRRTRLALPTRAQGHDRCEARLAQLEQLLGDGRLERAAALAGSQATAARRAGWGWLACRAALCQAEAVLRLGRHAEGEALLRAAADAALEAGYSSELALAGLLEAVLLRGRGALGDARARLGEVAAAADGAGLQALAEAARAGLAAPDDAGPRAHPAGVRLARRLGLCGAIVCRARGPEGTRWLTAEQATALPRSGARVDLVRGRIELGRRSIDLSRRRTLLDVLGALAASPGAPVAVDTVVRRAWNVDYHPLRHRSRVVMSIARLRRLLGARAIGVAERGYRLMLGERWTVLEAVAGPECDPM